jgi:GT2 family glycosyltransferase
MPGLDSSCSAGLENVVQDNITSLSVSVVIPTFLRPASLIDCLASIVRGNRQPNEICIIAREADTPTREAFPLAQELCAGKTTLRTAWVTEPGHLPPVKKGFELASSDIVAFVDDDITVQAKWLTHLLTLFEDPTVGVVGGRVVTPGSKPPRFKGIPGWTSWYGKHWGNVANVPGETPLDVQGVMECNWAWRRELLSSLRFDSVLNFDDAAMYGLDLCLQARSKGLRVVYEPRALVCHHAVPRSPELDRADRPRRDFSYSRNYTYIMLKHLPWWRRPIFIAWWFLIGERGSWGLGCALADMLTNRAPSLSHIWRTLTGKIQGMMLFGSALRERGY